jgi:hypothetical protein
MCINQKLCTYLDNRAGRCDGNKANQRAVRGTDQVPDDVPMRAELYSSQGDKGREGASSS